MDQEEGFLVKFPCYVIVRRDNVKFDVVIGIVSLRGAPDYFSIPRSEGGKALLVFSDLDLAEDYMKAKGLENEAVPAPLLHKEALRF
jgi:siroheme synthase